MSKSSARQFIVDIQGFPGTWMTKTGGDISSDVAKAWDGGNPVPDLLTGPSSVDNLTVSRVYDPVRDEVIKQFCKKNVGRFRPTITVTPVDQDGIAVGDPDVYSPTVLVRYKAPDVDASSGDPAPFELEFAVSDVN